ncbi:MAG: hypothetical protein AAB336_05345 [Acidobacteriota bacterium]
MESKQFFLGLLMAFLSLSSSIFAFGDATNSAGLADQAISENKGESGFAIRELRGLGAVGLQTLFENYAADIENYKKTGEVTERWQKIAKALDSVAMQKDVYASKLFWLTDLEKAKSESKRANKPILSLRLLGNLNEELSCANSRFFRSILYPNAQISKYLQENYILHWKSERPAPKITIDFGDGRKIERTITGNSIHYILDSDGKVIDALSGLNSPQTFYDFLYSGNALPRNTAQTQIAVAARNSALTNYRGRKYQNLTTQINRIGKNLKLEFDTTHQPNRNFEEMPPAIMAMTVATTKMIVEMPDLKNITADITKYGEEQIKLESWKQIAKLSGKEAKLDENSINFIRLQVAKNMSDQELKSMITKLEEYVSIDTARNEFLLRPTLLVWLAKGENAELENFNKRVYSELFLTPQEDKWLGLYAPDIYTALDGNGIN